MAIHAVTFRSSYQFAAKGFMKNPGSGEKLPITSRTSGIFFARSADRFARPGKIIGKVAGTEPLEGKGPFLLTS